MKKVLLTVLSSVLIFSVLAQEAGSPAQATYDLRMNGDDPTTYSKAFPVLTETSQIRDGKVVYSGNGTFDYTVFESTEREPLNGVDRQTARIYFTNNTGSAITFQIWQEIEDNTNPIEISYDYESGNHSVTKSFTVSDYGIYLYDPETNVSDYSGVSFENGSFAFGDVVDPAAATNNNLSGIGGKIFTVEDGESFGVYYKDGDNYITTTGNWVGNYDNETAHETTIYDENTAMKEITTSEPFMCLFQGDVETTDWPIERQHYEFIFVEKTPQPQPPAGGPLPGSLATMLVGGFCAAFLRKRGKKN